LKIGTEEEPFEHRAVVTVHGDRYKDIEIPQIGAKCLAVATKGAVAHMSDAGEHFKAIDIGQLEVKSILV
jgi:hypothetical protein